MRRGDVDDDGDDEHFATAKQLSPNVMPRAIDGAVERSWDAIESKLPDESAFEHI